MKWLAAILCGVFAVAAVGYGAWVEAASRATAAIEDAKAQVRWFRELAAVQQETIAMQNRLLQAEEINVAETEAAPAVRPAAPPAVAAAEEPARSTTYVVNIPPPAAAPPVVVIEEPVNIPYIVYAPYPAYSGYVYEAVWPAPGYNGSWRQCLRAGNCPYGVTRRKPVLGHSTWPPSYSAKVPTGDRRATTPAPAPHGVRSAASAGQTIAPRAPSAAKQ